MERTDAMLWAILSAGALSFLLGWLGTPLARRVAVRLGFFDRPVAHKAHSQATPLLGGSAVFAAVLAPTLLGLALARLWAAYGVPEWLSLPGSVAAHLPGAAGRAGQALGILAAASGLHLLGLLDDRRGLGPWVKLFVQLLAAGAVVVFCDVRVLTFAGPTLSIAASILWIVVITNAMNFLDNADGLAAGVGAIVAAALLAASVSMGQWFVAAWSAVLCGALLGFLPHNFPPATIFLGDGGSLVIGFLLAVVSCLTTYVRPDSEHMTYGVLAPLMLLAIPLYDTASVMWLRLREGRNPMIGDRRHFSHRLARRGMSPQKVALTVYVCTASTALAAFLLPHVTSPLAACVLAGQVVCILMLIALLESAEGA
jgi:UDP-GlcNAc:undecaprenyl-phosphate/decaprenyl-phosphate GlcNAc-1-phosphate transferase